MKKQKIVFILIAILILIVSIFLAYKYVFIKPHLNVQSIQEISITALPSPPKVKHVRKQKDIKIVVDFFNSLSFAPTIDQNLKGWKYKIQISSDEQHSIYIVGNRVEFDGVWYITKNNVIEVMDKLYKALNYPEEVVNDQTSDGSKQSKYSDIIKYAQNFMKKYRSNVNLDNPILLYNVNNEVVSLFFSDKSGGYIIVNMDGESVPEFSPVSNNKFIVDKTKKYFYNGPTVYMEEVNNEIIDSKYRSKIGTLDDLKFKYKNRKIYKANKESISSNGTKTITNYAAAVKIIKGTVPNYSYNPDGICGSTASSMFLRYYDIYINAKYVPSSLETSDGAALIKTLVPFIDGDIPGSNAGQLELGVYNYLKSQGINATICLDYSSVGSISGRVGNNQPYILGLNNAPQYGDHWVTGYGYSGKYAIVNDGWGSTSVYIDTAYTDYIVY